MKKLSVLILVLLMVCLVAMPVLAVQTATLTVSASKTTLKPDDTFTVTVSTTRVDDCTTGGFMFQYDKNVFAYVDGSALVGGFTMAGVSTAGGNVAGYCMLTSGSTTIEGDLFRITLQVKDNASAGSYTISGVPSVTILNGTAKEAVSATAGSVTVTVSTDGAKPTEEETVAATTEAAESATSEATTEATTASTTETTEAIPTKGDDAPAPTEIITIGATAPVVEKAGFPWWIPFALLGVGSIIAIVILKKKS